MAKIQVILTQDVAGQGRKGDLITVSAIRGPGIGRTRIRLFWSES